MALFDKAFGGGSQANNGTQTPTTTQQPSSQQGFLSRAVAGNIQPSNNTPQPRQSRPSTPAYRITTSKGVQYTLDNNQTRWIQNRFMADQAGTYGLDDADQFAKANGQMSAKWRSTYKNSNVDRQLAELGLPSEKYLEKYMGEYQSWHTGGIDDVFGNNVPPDAWTWMKNDYSQKWEYEDTAEDQARKRQGIMPKALEANYTDTEIDDELKAAGLPSIKDYDKYAQRYNNYRGIDNLYRNAAGALTAIKMTQDVDGNYIQNDDKPYTVRINEAGDTETKTGKQWYAQAFYNELDRKNEDGTMFYGNILPLMKKSTYEDTAVDYIDPTKSYIEEMDKKFSAYGKAEALDDDYKDYSAFSYDDFMRNYDQYYDKYWKDFKLSDGKTVSEQNDIIAREQDAERQKKFYDIRDRWFDDDVGIYAFIDRYMKDYPTATPEQMFRDMFNNGVDQKIVYKTMRYLREGAVVPTPTQKNRSESGWGFDDITDAYARVVTPVDENGQRDYSRSGQRDYRPNPQNTIEAFTGKKDVKERYNQLDDERNMFVDASIKRDEEDEDTISDTATAIKNALSVFLDEDEGVGVSGDADKVLEVLDSLEKEAFTNPVAMRIALEDLGFSEFGQFSGLAQDLTYGWSEDEKTKLALSLGATRMVDTENQSSDFDKAFGRILGDWANSNGIVSSSKKLDHEKFMYSLDWAEAQIAAGRLTEEEAFNVLAGAGYQDELETYLPERWHKSHFKESIVPMEFQQSGGAQLAMWDGMTPEQRDELAENMWNDLTDEQKATMFGDANWWKADPTVYRTFGQALEQQFAAIIPGLATDIVSGGVKLADMINANITGRPELREGTQDWMKAQEYVQRYGSVADGINGANLASMGADVTQEIAKMYILGNIGGAIGEGTKVGQALASFSSGASSKVVQKLTGFALDMLQASPFVVSATAHNYSEAKSMGATNAEATSYAILTGMTEGILEGMNFDHLWGRVIGQEGIAKQLLDGANQFKNMGVIAKARLMSMVVSGLGEFTEESIGYVLETYLKTKSIWGKGTEWSAEDWIQQAGMGFLTGFLGGGLSAGSINEYDIIRDYIADNAPSNPDWVDQALSDAVWNNLPLSTANQYKNGGARILSTDAYAQVLNQVKVCAEDSQNIIDSYKKSEAAAQEKLRSQLIELNGFSSKAISLDVTNSSDVAEFAKLCKKLGITVDMNSNVPIREQVKPQIAERVNSLESVYNTTIANARATAETKLENAELQLKDLQKQLQEHYAGIHLMTEPMVIYHKAEEMSAAMANARQNGANVTPESRVSEETSSRAAENAAETEGKAIDPNTINWFGKKTKLEKGDVKTRPFTDEDAQKVVDVAAKLKYQGKVSFIDDPEQNWNGKISLLNGDIVINKAKLTAYDVDKLQSNPALWVLEHELNHFMKSRGGESYNKFHEAVVRMLKNSPYVNGNEQTYNEVVDGLIKSREEQGLGKLTRSQAEEELVGNFAMEYLFDSEDAINSLFQTNGSVGEQILSWLRYKIDRAKLRRSKESWARDILDIERMYAKAYRDTKNKPQSEASKAETATGELYDARQLQTSYTNLENNPYDYSRPLSKRLADWRDSYNKVKNGKESELRKGDLSPRSPLLIGMARKALNEIGLSRLPLLLNPKHVKYVVDEESYKNDYERDGKKLKKDYRYDHVYSDEDFAKLPQKIADPVAIIKQGDGLLVLTDLLSTKTHRPTVVSIQLGRRTDSYGTPIDTNMVNGQQVEAYMIKSIHGSDLYVKMLNDALQNDSDSDPRVFYLNKDKAFGFDGINKEKANSLQGDGDTSTVTSKTNTFVRSIAQSDLFVKANLNKQSETRQFNRWLGVFRNKDGKIISPNEVTLVRYNTGNSEEIKPVPVYKVDGKENTYTTKKPSADAEPFYLSLNKLITPEQFKNKSAELGSESKASDFYENSDGRYGIRRKYSDGTYEFTIFDKANAKSAKRNVGLYDRTNDNPYFSGSGDESLDFLGNYKGKSNPLTGVTAEEDEAYMRAALAGDTETAGRMVRDMYERNGLMHVYRGENEPTGTSTTVDTKRMGIIGGMFATDNPAVAGSREYTNSSDAQAANVKPLSYGKNVMTVLQRFADGVAERIGNGTNLVAESYYTDGSGNQYADDGDGRVRHWVLRDADTGEVFSEGTSLSAVSEDARRKAADIIGGDTNGVFNSIEDPFAGRILDLFVKFDNANEHDAEGGNWDAVTGDVSLYSIDVTKGPRGTYVVNVYPASYGSENSSSSERVVMSETFKSKNDLDYEYNMEQAFKRLFGENSNVFDFFAENAEWGDDGSATLDAVGVDNNDGTYIYPDMLESLSTDEIALRDKYEGYDGTIIRNVVDGQMGLAPAATDTVSYNPNYIKSGDAIVYDDNGEIIPLSERGDFSRNELRYSGQDTSIEELLRRYGAKPEGREPRARDVKVPNQTNDQNRVSNLGRSILESDKVTDDQVEAIKQKIATEDWMSYIPKTNAETMEEARNYIAARQPLAAQQEFHDMVMSGKLGTKTNAIGLQLLSDASERGDFDSFMSIATDLQIAATEAGQSAQIFNVLKELKGVGSAYYMQRVIDRLNSKYDDLIQKGKMERITVSQDLMDKLTQAKTVDQIAAAEEAVAKEIARQVPLTWSDRLSSWRYFSMLANPTTHVRNMFGNLLMKGLNTVKDAVATGIENVGGVAEDQRAHAVLTSADRAKWQGFADESYKEQARNLSGGGKLGFETFVKQNMRSFDTKWVNALAQLNFKALEGEDVLFIRPAYKNALMQYMKAQGFTLNEKGQAGKVDAKGKFREISHADMTAAVEWASQQAWKQTFRDASSLATMLNKLSKEGPIAKLLVEGVMPFKKTPINIAKRGIEYSPAGIIMGTVQLATKVKQGKMSAATAIDNLASGITGTALMALGVFLAKAGLIRAGGEDKKKYETYLQDTGDQTYAMKFGDASINMSAIAPATIPLFMGVALNEMVERSGDSVDLSTITDTIAGTLNPFMEMSFMSSLNSALQSYSNDGIGGALGNTILSAAQNYGSQYLPTLGGKLAQFFDPTRRTTKSDATSPIGGNMDYYARSLAKKVPGLEATLQPDVDVWGRTDTKDSFGDWALDFFNKFILPTNVKVANRDSVDNELIRVVESTGVTDFLPSDGNKYFTVKGERYNMNSKQYAQFSQDRGQAAYAAIKDVMSTPAYQAASDEAKADMLKKSLDAAYKQVNNLWKDKLGAYNGK